MKEDLGEDKRLPRDKADFGIISIIDEEMEEIDNILKLSGPKMRNGRQYWYCWVPARSGPKSEHFVVCGKCRDRSTNPAHDLAKDMIITWRPCFIIVVGIGGGVEGRDGLALGDVVASDFVRGYEFCKHEEAGEKTEFISWNAICNFFKRKKGRKKFRELPTELPSPHLRDIIARLKMKSHKGTWRFEIKDPLDRETLTPDIVSGEILSGEKIFCDPEDPELHELLNEFDKANAVETESVGVGNAIYEMKGNLDPELRPDYMVLRGISDFCNRKGNQETRENWRGRAASAAATLALEVMAEVQAFTKRPPEGEKYIESLKKEIDDPKNLYTTPSGEFEIPIRSGERHLTDEDLITTLDEEKVVLMQGVAGGGKSIFLGRFARRLLKEEIAPVLIDLKNWEDESTAYFQERDIEPETIDPMIENLLGMALAKKHLNVGVLNALVEAGKTVIMVDALNEVSAGEFGQRRIRKLLKLLYAKANSELPNLSILVTDRPGSRDYIEGDWKRIHLEQMREEYVRKRIDGTFGAGKYDNLGNLNRSLLWTPYYLQYALERDSPEMASGAEAIYSFFHSRMKLSDSNLEKLGRAAFSAYKESKCTKFDIERFRKDLDDDSIYERLFSDDVLRTKDNGTGTGTGTGTGKAVFDHQLKHDFLASRYLSRHEKEWNWLSFDGITFQSNSTEPLSMMFEQLDNREARDRLIMSIYNWNWPATISCMARSTRCDPGSFSNEIVIAVLAIISEKMLDPVKKSSANARKWLDNFPGEVADRFRKAAGPEDINKLIEHHSSNVEWFMHWKKLFIRRTEEPLNEEEIEMITEENPMLGWTAANVIRRFGLSEADCQQLRAYYSSGDNTIRWRVVHALGAFPTEKNAKKLFSALESDEYEWAKYGAARSLIEHAAKTSDDNLRNHVIDGLKRQIPGLREQILDEIGEAICYDGAVDQWDTAAASLLEEMKKDGRVDGEKMMKKFKEFCAAKGRGNSRKNASEQTMGVNENK